MGAAHRCHMADCSAIATDRCFECGAWCCDGHRSTIQIPTHSDPFREMLCPACLMLHLATPDRYGRIAVEQPATGKVSEGTPGLELGL